MKKKLLESGIHFFGIFEKADKENKFVITTT
jgi:hypothetical protein